MDTFGGAAFEILRDLVAVLTAVFEDRHSQPSPSPAGRAGTAKSRLSSIVA